MKTFEYSTREYTPSIDLNTLGQTFSTLEQGHKEAVKAASDLEVAVANLKMNEAEDGFKQQLVNEIKDTVDNNTIYGNSYGALDDLIMQSGNIASDGRIIGRLRSQAAKEEYDKKVDAMSIPDGMKQMYKEKNPYHYEDGGIDERTGRYLPGETWKPTTNPVTTIPEAEIQKYALQIAAKDAGGGESVSFLDENGRPTSDPTKSEDGSMYKKVGTKWERLSKDKIKKAYDVAIDSIPGAADSLKQDYEYANYERDKLAKKSDNPNPYVKGLTDKNGNIYQYNQWLNNRINGFADVAAYNHVYSSVDYGTALQNRRAREAQAKAQAGVNDNGAKDTGFGTFIAGTKEVEGNAFAGAESAKAAANQQGLSIVKRIAGDAFKGADSITDIIRMTKLKNGASGPGIAANYIIGKYGKHMTQQQKVQLINSFKGYVSANAQYNKMIQAAGSDADALRFSADVANQNFNNNNKYSRAIINSLNNYFKRNDYARWKVGKDVFNELTNLYKTDIAGLRNMGIIISNDEDGNFDVKIDAQHRNLIPKFAATIREADDRVPGSIGGWFKNKFTTGVGSGNYYEYGIGAPMGDVPLRSSTFSNLTQQYKRGLEAGAKVEKKVGVSKGTISIMGVDASSYGALWERENAVANGINESELQNRIERQDAQVDLMFSAGNFDSGLIEQFDAAGRLTKVTNGVQNAKYLIQSMYANDEWRKKIKRTVMVPSSTTAGQPKGYYLTFTVPKGLNVDGYKEGQTYRFAVSGVNDEEKNYDPSYNPTTLANNALITARATGSNVEGLGYDREFGDTRLTANKNGSYHTNFMGANRNLDSATAEQYTSILYTLDQLKAQYQSGTFHDSTLHLQQLDNSLKTISENLSVITNVNANVIYNTIGNYFNYVE